MKTFFKASRMAPLVLMLAALLAAGVLVPLPAQAATAEDGSLEVKEMDLQIWPEYDDPRVLAIYTGTLTNSSGKEFNGRVYFNVPKEIEVRMACELINGGQHSCQPYELEDRGDYQVLSWKTTKPIAPGEDYPIWLEYYWNPIQGYPDKTIDLDYVPYYKTGALKLTVKEPLKSTNFKTDPAPASKGQDGEGFASDNFNFTNIGPDKPVTLNISYTRSEKEPSVEPLDPNTGQQGDASEPLGTSAWKKPEVIVPVILFVIVLALFIFYSVNRSQNAPPLDRVNRIHKKYGGKNGNVPDTRREAAPKMTKEKKRIRQMLLDGKISEETYRELIDELDNE